MSQNGKGSARRPTQVSKKVVDENWDRVFKKKLPIESTQECEEEKKDEQNNSHD